MAVSAGLVASTWLKFRLRPRVVGRLGHGPAHIILIIVIVMIIIIMIVMIVMIVIVVIVIIDIIPRVFAAVRRSVDSGGSCSSMAKNALTGFRPNSCPPAAFFTTLSLFEAYVGS